MPLSGWQTSVEALMEGEGDHVAGRQQWAPPSGQSYGRCCRGGDIRYLQDSHV